MNTNTEYSPIWSVLDRRELVGLADEHQRRDGDLVMRRAARRVGDVDGREAPGRRELREELARRRGEAGHEDPGERGHAKT
ncbi:hypothetical protein [Baekduia alba]|uniref:hypothetical protein n=1 Tax=Baekduia alba TaxID=2997333 RepID=UPI0023409041|nr:hypothetical protein [Baekduia alba]